MSWSEILHVYVMPVVLLGAAVEIWRKPTRGKRDWAYVAAATGLGVWGIVDGLLRLLE